QRISYPTFSQATGGLNITTISNSNLLPPGYYMLFLLNGNGVPSVAKIIRIAAVTTVNAPANLTAVPGTSTQINLAWTDSSNNEEGFKIERCQGSSCSNFMEIAQVGDGVTTYSDTGLSASTTYRYRVRAYAGNTNSSYTATVNATTPSTPVTGNGTGLKGDY